MGINIVLYNEMPMILDQLVRDYKAKYNKDITPQIILYQVSIATVLIWPVPLAMIISRTMK